MPWPFQRWKNFENQWNFDKVTAGYNRKNLWGYILTHRARLFNPVKKQRKFTYGGSRVKEYKGHDRREENIDRSWQSTARTNDRNSTAAGENILINTSHFLHENLPFVRIGRLSSELIAACLLFVEIPASSPSLVVINVSISSPSHLGTSDGSLVKGHQTLKSHQVHLLRFTYSLGSWQGEFWSFRSIKAKFIS